MEALPDVRSSGFSDKAVVYHSFYSLFWNGAIDIEKKDAMSSDNDGVAVAYMRLFALSCLLDSEDNPLNILTSTSSKFVVTLDKLTSSMCNSISSSETDFARDGSNELFQLVRSLLELCVSRWLRVASKIRAADIMTALLPMVFALTRLYLQSKQEPDVVKRLLFDYFVAKIVTKLEKLSPGVFTDEGKVGLFAYMIVFTAA